jgi:cytochrome c
LISAWDIAVMPDGKGLPSGKGTATEGAGVYANKCASCHGPNGEGGSAEALVGPEPKAFMPFGPKYDKQRGDKKDVPFTIGNYWPYATTIFDYTRRAMPYNKPGTLSANEIYSVVAWILMKNSIIPADAVMDAKTLPAVMMPARNRFVRDDRIGGPRVKE